MNKTSAQCTQYGGSVDGEGMDVGIWAHSSYRGGTPLPLKTPFAPSGGSGRIELYSQLYTLASIAG
jgi:hypothetical protein